MVVIAQSCHPSILARIAEVLRDYTLPGVV